MHHDRFIKKKSIIAAKYIDEIGGGRDQLKIMHVLQKKSNQRKELGTAVEHQVSSP